MKLHRVWASLVLFAVCGGCGTVADDAISPELEFAAAPLGETAGGASGAQPGFVLVNDTTLGAGSFVGDVFLERSRMQLRGAGVDETVIEGNLTVTDQCRVEHLTVTGDLIFAGNTARAVAVRCLGQVLDYGVGNRH